jgi:hypothetical protein
VLGEMLLGGSFEEKMKMLESVIDYLGAVLLHVPFAESLEEMPEWCTVYNVEQWRFENYAEPLEKYRFQEPQTFLTSVSPETFAKINTRVNTFGEHPAGLGKFTRTMFAKDLRRSIAIKNIDGNHDLGVAK